MHSSTPIPPLWDEVGCPRHNLSGTPPAGSRLGAPQKPGHRPYGPDETERNGAPPSLVSQKPGHRLYEPDETERDVAAA